MGGYHWGYWDIYQTKLSSYCGGGGEHHKLHVKLPQEDNRSVMTTGVLRDEKLPNQRGEKTIDILNS